jgi:hypothetical protein
MWTREEKQSHHPSVMDLRLTKAPNQEKNDNTLGIDAFINASRDHSEVIEPSSNSSKQYQFDIFVIIDY